LAIINGLIPFFWNMFTTHQTVCGQQECDFSILGRFNLLAVEPGISVNRRLVLTTLPRKSRVRLPRDKIFRLRLHQNLDPLDRDSESRWSILCGILLFAPHQSYLVASLALRLTRLVRRLASLAHRSTGNAQSFRGVPRLLTTPGQTLTPPCRTNFVRKDSGWWCNLNLKI